MISRNSYGNGTKTKSRAKLSLNNHITWVFQQITSHKQSILLRYFLNLKNNLLILFGIISGKCNFRTKLLQVVYENATPQRFQRFISSAICTCLEVLTKIVQKTVVKLQLFSSRHKIYFVLFVLFKRYFLTFYYWFWVRNFKNSNIGYSAIYQ